MNNTSCQRTLADKQPVSAAGEDELEEEAQAMAEAEYAAYGARVRVEFHGIVPPGPDPYIIPGDLA